MSILTAGLLFLSGVSALGSALGTESCAGLFTKTKSAEELRIQQVIEHQNQLRTRKHLPLLALFDKQRDYAMQVEGTTNKKLWIEALDAFPDEPVLGGLTMTKNTVVRRFINDLYSLNYVYSFKDNKLHSAEPFVLWNLNNLPGQEVVLYRQMSLAEYRLWKNKEYDKLGADWGFQSDTGQSVKVMHFSTDPVFTTAIVGSESTTIEVRIPKAKLLEWTQRTKLLWSAALNPQSTVSEFILPPALVKNLAASNDLQMHIWQQR